MSYPPLDLSPTTPIHSASPTSRGKGRAPSEGDELDAEGETDVEAPLTPVDAAPPKPRKKKKKRKPKIPDFIDDDFSDFDIPVPPPPKKKQRLRVHSPAPPAQVTYPRVKIRLRIPGKGKAREEEERKGLFDDILSVEDRDTVKTTVEATDKLRFERSRAAAEVGHIALAKSPHYLKHVLDRLSSLHQHLHCHPRSPYALPAILSTYQKPQDPPRVLSAPQPSPTSPHPS
jgi:hypothetical protein